MDEGPFKNSEGQGGQFVDYKQSPGRKPSSLCSDDECWGSDWRISRMEGQKLSSSSIGGTLFAASLGNGGTGTSIGGGRVGSSGATSPTTAVSTTTTGAPPSALSSSEIISMIKKGAGSGMGLEGTSLKTTPSSPLPAQQAAPLPRQDDDLGMLRLADRIKAAHANPSSLALGMESEMFVKALTAIALEGQLEDGNSIESSGKSPATASIMLTKTMASPWAEIGAATGAPGGGTRKGGLGVNSLESILPACYNVQAPPHAATRLASFTEETLFYMFYGMPRDRMQEMAARELTLNRGWRYHLGLKLWLLPASATPTAVANMTAGISALRMSPPPGTPRDQLGKLSQKGPLLGREEGGRPPGMEDDRVSYIVFDPSNWSKVRREMTPVRDDQLEDRFSPSSPTMAATAAIGAAGASTLSLALTGNK